MENEVVLTVLAKRERDFDAGLKVPILRRILSVEDFSARRYLSELDAPFALSLRAKLKNVDFATANLWFQKLSHVCLGRLDFILMPASLYDTPKKLAIFDFDSTLTPSEGIDELAAAHGVGEEVAKMTKLAMEGGWDFAQSFTKRLALLKGLPFSEVLEVAQKIELQPGARQLIRALKAKKCEVMVASGGFSVFFKMLNEKYDLGLNSAFIHDIPLEKDTAGREVVSGQAPAVIIGAEQKSEFLKSQISKLGLTTSQVMAVGDGANDIPMLKLAGLGVAFCAKPKVRNEAAYCVNIPSLCSVAHLLGFTDEELEVHSR